MWEDRTRGETLLCIFLDWRVLVADVGIINIYYYYGLDYVQEGKPCIEII